VINLKLALLATGAAGAITAGGAAYAMVGSSSPASNAKPAADSAKKAVGDVTAKVPAGVPTCVSAPDAKLPKGKLPKGEVPKAGLPKDKLPKAELPGAAQKPNLPVPTDKVKAPGTLPTDKVKAPANLPTDKAKLPTDKANVPTTLPTCAPGVGQAGQAGQAATQSAPVPSAKPGLPKVDVPAGQLPSCSSVPPAITVQNSKAKDVTLPNGMHLAASHSHSITIQNGQICTVVQKFQGAGGNYLTVERLNTPPQVTVKELAAELKLPQGGLVSGDTTETWQSPLNTGMLFLSDKGYAVYLTGSPVYAGQLPSIATQLGQLH
jgi:hypothetical protein